MRYEKWGKNWPKLCAYTKMLTTTMMMMRGGGKEAMIMSSSSSSSRGGCSFSSLSSSSFRGAAVNAGRFLFQYRKRPFSLPARASSKSSKLGRFPPVPVRERRRRGERREDDDDDNDAQQNKKKNEGLTHFERVLDELRRRSGHDASSSSFSERERSAFEEV